MVAHVSSWSSTSQLELQDLTSRLTYRATAYGMQVSTEKSKLMTNNNFEQHSTDITMNGQLLEEVTRFKYLRATLCKDGTCSAEICIRIAATVAAMARLNRIWWCNAISFMSKLKLYKSLVSSTCPCVCWLWEKDPDLQKPSVWGNLSTSPTWSMQPMTGCWARSTSLWLHWNFFWQLSRNGSAHGFGRSHAMTTSPKPSSGHLGGWMKLLLLQCLYECLYILMSALIAGFILMSAYLKHGLGEFCYWHIIRWWWWFVLSCLKSLLAVCKFNLIGGLIPWWILSICTQYALSLQEGWG